MKRPLLLLATCVLLLQPGCSKPLDPAQTANAFFAGIGQGKIHEAYESTSYSFQASLPEKSFESIVRNLNLTEKTLVCEWKPAAAGKDEVKLEGTVTSVDGIKMPISTRLIRERGAWRVFTLHTGKEKSAAAAETDTRFTLIGKGLSFNDAAAQEPPADRVLRQLVEDDLVMFNDAIQRRSFAEFYNNVSYSWQQQLTLKQLQRAFQGFIDKKVNLGRLRTLTATFDFPPKVDPDGVLLVVGHYPAQPFPEPGKPDQTAKVHFTLRYTYELPKWKLLGIDVQLTH